MNPIRGTYDLYDIEMLIHNDVIDTLKEIAQVYNFTEIKTPIIEKSELFNRTTGESSDIVQKEMYTFKDKSDRELALRPELTAGVARSFLTNKIYGQRKSQYKFYYYGEAFRYERPQKGRYRQFYQFGVEMFGDSTVYSDVETILLANNIITTFGLNNKTELKINTIGSSEERKNYNELLKNYFAQYKEELCPDCKKRLELNPLRILDCKIDREKTFVKTSPSLKDSLSKNSIDKYYSILILLDELDINYTEDSTLVRGLDYYNDIVFEFVYNDLHTLIGGGRYDKLIEQLGGQKIPAIGFGVGIERLTQAFKEENPELLENYKTEIDILYVGLTHKAFPIILKSMDSLRKNGIICSCIFNKEGLKQQIKEGLKSNAVYMIIIGQEELENKEVTVKNLVAKTETKTTLEKFEQEIINNACTNIKENL